MKTPAMAPLGMTALVHHVHDAAWLRRWPADFPELGWALAFTPQDLEREIADADILLMTNRAATPELGALLRTHATRLKWIHFLTAGFDRGIAMGLPEGVRVSYAAGVKAPLVAEHAMALLLALIRALPGISVDQRARLWRREEISAQISTLDEACVCLLGLGHLGRDLAKKLRPFRTRTVAVSREGREAAGVEKIYPRNEIRDALGRAAAVIVCTSAAERGAALLGAGEIAAMKKGALLVNVARGSLVDEASLIAALRSGHLRGAGLDVQAAEPLPRDSALWDLPNVIVSPHSAGAGSDGYPAHRTLFRMNLERFHNGAPLLNQYR